MNEPVESAIVAGRIARILERNKQMIKLSLQACAHCALCAESCFEFQASGGNPGYTPSYKAINSIGKIYRKRGKLSESEYRAVSDLVWNRCVLCMRCYCPVGISVPSLIACARNVCRERGVFRAYDGARNA
ncbi:MAG TPA: (Fe-S)-binding protein [Spirochaetia bacterium]|nr:(Fe-S)-binding protein [Spirochaetia bacterium]